MKILLVEDEVKLAQRLKKELKQESYVVDVVYDGNMAFDYIISNHETLDLILLDEMLPGKQGSEICKLVRSSSIFTPILMLTAKDLDTDIAYGLREGADDYLTKPFSLYVLFARIEALLRRPRQIAFPVEKIICGNFTLNQKTHKIWYKRKELSLTLKEYNLLEYLMKHPNTVIDREKLLEKAWDVNFDSFSNVVDVQIMRLRKKLQTISNKQVIETIRGIGFKLNV